MIKDEEEYSTVMDKVDKLMTKGSPNVSPDELEEIKRLALSAQAYEQTKYDLATSEKAI